MKKYFFILLILTSAAGYSQAPNIIYGKDVIIQTRDTSSAELTIKNSTRNVLGYFKNIGSGKGQYTIIPQVDITGLPDSLLARYTKAQSDARFKPISYVPDWLELTGVPSNFSTTYALSNDIQDSLLNKVSRSGTYADPSFISSLSWSKLTGVPALITLADSTTILAGRWLPNRSADTASALQARIQTKSPLEGSTAINTVGTIVTGTWQASQIADAYISSAATWNAKQNALGFTPENLANKGIANGYADLDALGKIPASRIDFTQTGQTYVVASQTAMLAITGANVGAIAIRTDENKNYRLIGLPASTLSNWLALLTPDAPVQSVNGFTGNVNLLTTHVTEGSSYYWTAARSRAAQSLTTTGNSGAASYDNSSGVLNIPNYTLAGLGGQPALSGTGFVKISGTTITYDNSTYLTSFTETDPTIYSWAKASSKPTYSWGEITGTVPTWNQNTTGTAANTTAISGINSNLSSAVQSGTVSSILGQDVNNNLYRYNASAVQTFLGLGPMAYQPTGAWVDIANAQSISGVKTFTGGIRMTGGIVFGESGKSLAKMNSSGTYYGGIQNTSSDRWALTYSNTTTDALGTEVLAWTPSSVILSQALSGTTAIFNNSGYSLEAGSPGASQKVRIGVNSTGYSSIQGSNYSNTATDLTINPDGGNVGVNTTTPSYKFETSLSVSSSYVGAFSNATDNLRILIGTTSGGATNIQSKTISTNVPYQLLLNAEGGRVGIGSGSPMYTLDVFGTGRFADEIYTNGVYSTAFGPRFSGGSVVFRNWAGATLAYLNDAGAAIFGSSLTTGAGMYAKDIVSINSNAYPSTYPTSIGANTSAEGFIQLGNNSVNRIIAGSGTAGGFIDFVVNNTTVLPTGADGTVAVRMASTGIVSIYSSAASTSTSTGALIINGGLGVAGAINAGSDVVAYSTSDRRLKDNISPIQNALYKLNQLTGNEFDWNNKQELYTGHDYGVIAQEVEKVLPYAITIRDNGYYGVKYDRIIPLIIEAVKELKAQVDQLKSN